MAYLPRRILAIEAETPGDMFAAGKMAEAFQQRISNGESKPGRRHGAFYRMEGRAAYVWASETQVTVSFKQV